MVTDKEYTRMAKILCIDDEPRKTWPYDEFDKLILLEAMDREKFLYTIRAMLNPPKRVCCHCHCHCHD